MDIRKVDIHLKGYPSPFVRSYLSENDFEPEFSLLKRTYYLVARPILPLWIRHQLQRSYARRVECLPDFIWPDLVDLLKSNEAAWDRFIKGLYPAGYNTAIVLTHDVETQRGFDFIPQVIELEKAYGFRSSWNIVCSKYNIHRDIVEFIRNSGHEIGIHGYNHDGTDYYSRQRFTERAAYVNSALEQYGAVGFRSPQVHRNLGWLQDLDVLYDASCFDYDPYQPFPGGTGSIWPFMAGRFVELPYTLPQDHVLFYTRAEKDISIWERKVGWLAAHHGMILALTHPDYLQEKNHLDLYEDLLTCLRRLPNAWHCLPREIAAWFKESREDTTGRVESYANWE